MRHEDFVSRINKTTKEELDIGIHEAKGRNFRYCLIFKCSDTSCYHLYTNKKDFQYCCLHVPVKYITKPISEWICRTCALRVWETKFVSVKDQ